MNMEQAVKLWADRDFSVIPTELIKKAYCLDIEELELLTSKFPELDYPAGWGYMFHPSNRLDEEWIKDNLEEVEACGFLVYECDEAGVLLGVDGCGYDFYEEHWKPLYKAMGLKWHNEEEGKEAVLN